jgi:sodium-dependent dicarboxylate transporter 2/3/5
MSAPVDAALSLRTVGKLAAGPVAAALTLFVLPHEYRDAAGEVVPFDPAGRATLCVMAWMAAWWLTEAVEIAVTALLPLVLFPLVGAATIRAAAAPYSHPLIFLFMGGFLLALSMQRWGLDRRIALYTLRVVGTEPTRMIGGFMLVTAGLSMFVSNTATAAMMLPIGLSVIALTGRDRDGVDAGPPAPGSPGHSFALALLLGIAYSASIGGIGTIIGTPPNALLVGFARDSIAEPYRMEISFARWLAIGLPLVAVLLPIAWLLLTRVLFPIRIQTIRGSGEFLRGELRALGPFDRGEIATAVVFAMTASAWIARPLLVEMAPLRGLSDAGIAMTGAMLLFVIPGGGRGRRFVMDWSTARKLPWGILVLFGGGLSLAARVQDHGVADFIGSLVAGLPHLPTPLLVGAVAAIVLFLTELTSNTATTATMLPILAAIAPGLGVDPYLLIVPAALAASGAFMMPVATPPNAIVFGSGLLTIPEMCRAGLWLNVISVLLLTLLTLFVVAPVLGIG